MHTRTRETPPRGGQESRLRGRGQALPHPGWTTLSKVLPISGPGFLSSFFNPQPRTFLFSLLIARGEERERNIAPLPPPRETRPNRGPNRQPFGFTGRCCNQLSRTGQGAGLRLLAGENETKGPQRTHLTGMLRALDDEVPEKGSAGRWTQGKWPGDGRCPEARHAATVHQSPEAKDRAPPGPLPPPLGWETE